MGIQFKKASKKEAKGRVALIGPAGSGKTMTALKIAADLGAKVAVIDSERGSASKYADQFEFDVLELENFAPSNYVEAIKAAEQAGYDVIIVDSLSHAWMGKGGALEMVDKAQKRGGDNSFTAWREVTPEHNKLVDALVSSRSHIIATMRAKTAYEMEEYTDSNGRKKTKPVKIGLQPIQRDGLEFEFDVVCDLTVENDLIVGKTRCPALRGQVFNCAGADVAATLNDWLKGEAIEMASQAAIKQLAAACDVLSNLSVTDEQLIEGIERLTRLKPESLEESQLAKLTADQIAKVNAGFSRKVDEKQAEKERGAKTTAPAA